MSAPATARARVRAQLTREIVDAARLELAESGAAGLSLRAVARRLGMVPSALYRYFDSRDALLTALIVDAYGSVGAAAEAADAGAAGEGPLGRWLAVARAVRRWGADHPQEWALVYGSPVPGYRAPQDTVVAALRITTVVAGIVADAVAPGSSAIGGLPPGPAGLGPAVAPVEALLLPGRPPEVVAGAVVAWTQLIGTVSLELFGHYVGAAEDFDVVFDYTMAATAHLLGLGVG